MKFCQKSLQKKRNFIFRIKKKQKKQNFLKSFHNFKLFGTFLLLLGHFHIIRIRFLFTTKEIEERVIPFRQDIHQFSTFFRNQISRVENVRDFFDSEFFHALENWNNVLHTLHFGDGTVDNECLILPNEFGIVTEVEFHGIVGDFVTEVEFH